MLILARGARPEFLSLRGGSEGLRSATGHRAAGRIDPGRSKHLVSVDAAASSRSSSTSSRTTRRSTPPSASPAAARDRAEARPIPAPCSSRSKPLRDRKLSADQVIERLRGELAAVPGATLFLQAVGDLGTGGRSSNAQYQYTLQGSTFDELNEWTPKIVAALQTRADACRRQQRPAEQGPAGQHDHRPRYRLAPRDHGQPDRQHAVRCLRSAPGLDHLCGAQPVPRDHGGGAGISGRIRRR